MLMLIYIDAPALPPISRPVPLLVRLAAIVAMWYARSKKYGEKNVMYDSYAWYNHMLSDTSQMKNLPEVRGGTRSREGKGKKYGPVR